MQYHTRAIIHHKYYPRISSTLLHMHFQVVYALNLPFKCWYIKMVTFLIGAEHGGAGGALALRPGHSGGGLGGA